MYGHPGRFVHHEQPFILIQDRYGDLLRNQGERSLFDRLHHHPISRTQQMALGPPDCIDGHGP